MCNLFQQARRCGPVAALILAIAVLARTSAGGG